MNLSPLALDKSVPHDVVDVIDRIVFHQAGMRLITAIIGSTFAVFVLGICIMGFLTLIEALKLLFWNLRGCPRCGRQWAYPKSPVNFEFGRWRGGGLSHEHEVNGHTFERPWVVATCRHCSFAVRLKKAPVWD